MNRFRTKKRAKEGGDGAAPISRPSTELDGSGVPQLKPAKSWGRSKKSQEPEPKVELDLSTALPSSDDFRTSLLMNGLSARFSMLREQDDPNSKLGKASDDSVLFPSKRQSRLNGFGYDSNGLSDIAEVSSISGSIRPPFAAYARKDSYNTLDGYGTDDDTSSPGGSIMSRAKPGEGNNLFGGRQKIYKIPGGASASSKNLASGGGRLLYDDDVSQSAFQKIREREREQERLQREEEEEEREEEEQRAQASRPNSPPLAGYNRNRETSSTTSSGPNARISTAATSVTSQRTPSLNNGSHNTSVPSTPAVNNTTLERSTTKTRRLYESGLDKDVHEQQFSAMSRIDTLMRQRTFGASTPPPALISPTSSTSTFDRFDRQPVGGKTSMPNLRAQSPTPTSATMGTFDFPPKQSNTAETKPGFGFANPPLSPPISEDDGAVLPLQPNDRGKATALLAFSKPIQPYDENKYSQRQIQMQQGRETPPPRKASPPRPFVSRNPPDAARTRADSSATFTSGVSDSRSRSASSAQKDFLPTERTTRETPNPVTEITVPKDHIIATSGSFLMSPDESDSPDEIDVQTIKPWGRTESQSPSLPKGYRPDPNQSPILERPPEFMHPAHRPSPLLPQQSNDPTPDRSLPTPNSATNLNRLSTGYLTKPRPKSAHSEDSPTLGPTTGLSGMVRQHLRSDSNTSSVYGGGAPSAGFVSRFPQDPLEFLPSDYSSMKSNPWDLDEWDRSYPGGKRRSSEIKGIDLQATPPAPLSVRPANINSPTQGTRQPTWEQEMANHHERVGSVDTQIERKELADDLAARRRQVQEKMKSFAEPDNTRSGSPVPGMDWARENIKNNPLGLLKQKSSRGSLVVKTQKEKEQPQTKAKKMLGIGAATISSSPSPRKQVFDDHAWKKEEEEMMRGVKPATLGPQTKAFRQARRDAQRTREEQLMTRYQPNQMQQQRPVGMEHEWIGPKPIQTRPQQRPRGPSNERGPAHIHTGQPIYPGQRTRTPSRERQNHPPPTMQNNRRLNGNSRESQGSSSSSRSGSRPPSRTSRDRSSSGASGRSKSHNGRYRDDIAQAMADGIGSSAQGGYIQAPPVSARLMPKSPGAPGLAFQPSPSPSPNFQPSPSFQSSPSPSFQPSSFQQSPSFNEPAYSATTPTSQPPPKARSNSRSGYFDQSFPASQTLEPVEIGLTPRPSPVAPFVVNPTPPVSQPAPAGSSMNTPTTAGFQSNGRIPTNRKKSINKSEISEPTFLSSTSRVTTVNLPPGASLSNGSEPSPPIPPINPRRRQTRVQTMFGALAGRKEEPMPSMSLPQATQSTDEMSTFSADEADKAPKQRQKLRKSSSEGGNMNAKARQLAMAMPSPALPSAPSPPKIEGGMF